MKRFQVVAVVASLLAGPASASESESDWPGFRGSAIGRIDERPGSFARLDQIGMRVAWKVALGSGYSSVSIASGRAITMFSDGTSDFVISMDAADGTEQWRYRIGETYRGHDGSHDGPISTPLIAEGRVFGLSPQGKLFALDLDTGAEVWAVPVVEAEKATKPHYGFSTSPLFVDGTLVATVAAGKGRAVLGFDPVTGKVRWAAGDDTVNYQSPFSMDIGGKLHLIAVGDKKLQGIEASTGKLSWAYEHGGDQGPMGALSMNAVPAGDGRVLLARKTDEAEMVRLTPTDSGMSVASLWTSKGLRDSYATPVYHDGYLYGYRGRILTCVDAETGEMRWRSRPPGDGFITMVDGHLFIITKAGSLHVARATPDGYKEVDQMQLFEGYTWTPVAVANGHVYARGFEEVASIDLSEVSASDVVGDFSIPFPDTDFGRFVASLETAEDKPARLDAYFAQVESFPIVEGRYIHFVYRGPGSDGDARVARTEGHLPRDAHPDLVEPCEAPGPLVDPANRRAAKARPVTFGFGSARRSGKQRSHDCDDLETLQAPLPKRADLVTTASLVNRHGVRTAASAQSCAGRAIAYRLRRPRRYITSPTMAGLASKPSSRLFSARTSKRSPCFRTTASPSRPIT